MDELNAISSPAAGSQRLQNEASESADHDGAEEAGDDQTCQHAALLWVLVIEVACGWRYLWSHVRGAAVGNLVGWKWLRALAVRSL